MHLKMSSGKWRPFCLGLNVLNTFLRLAHMKHHSHGYELNPDVPSFRQNGHHDDIFKCIFLNENVWISIKISLQFILKGPINTIPALV